MPVHQETNARFLGQVSIKSQKERKSKRKLLWAEKSARWRYINVYCTYGGRMTLGWLDQNQLCFFFRRTGQATSSPHSASLRTPHLVQMIVPHGKDLAIAPGRWKKQKLWDMAWYNHLHAILVPLQDPNRTLHIFALKSWPKRWKFCLCSPFVQQKIIEVIRLEVHFQVNPPYLGVQKKQTKNPAAVQWTYGNLQKDRHFFFTLIHQYVFKNGGLIFSTSFLGRQKHQPFFAAVTWCPWFSRQRSAPRGCSLWTTPRPWRWPSLRWPHDGRGVPREWPKAA